MKSNNRGHKTSLIIIKIFGGLAVLLLAGFYYYVDHNFKTAPVEKISIEMAAASSSILSESNSSEKKDSGASTLKNTIVTAYIKSIDANTVTLDYFDLLGGEAAEKAVVEDGYCTKEEVANYRCFNNGVVYFRNRNPKLRTFKLSPDVQVLSATTLDGHDVTFDDSGYGTTKLPLSELIKKYSEAISNGQEADFSNTPYLITLDGQNSVIKIRERFRP